MKLIKIAKQNFRVLSQGKFLSLFFSIVVVAILVVVIWRDWGNIINFPWKFNLANVIYFIIAHVLAMAAMILAWHLMILRLTNQNKWLQDFRIYSTSLVARRIPFPIWFIGSRVLMYRYENISTSIVLTASGLEVALLAFAGILCYIILAPWYTLTQSLPWYLPVGIGVIVLLIFIVRPSLLIDLINMARRYQKKDPLTTTIKRKDLIIWGALYLFTWFVDGIGLYYAITSFVVLPDGLLINIIGISTLSALTAMLTMILPAGFGLKELTMVTLLSPWLATSTGIILALAYRGMQTIVELVLLLISQYTTHGLAPNAISNRN